MKVHLPSSLKPPHTSHQHFYHQTRPKALQTSQLSHRKNQMTNCGNTSDTEAILSFSLLKMTGWYLGGLVQKAHALLWDFRTESHPFYINSQAWIRNTVAKTPKTCTMAPLEAIKMIERRCLMLYTKAYQTTVSFQLRSLQKSPYANMRRYIYALASPTQEASISK